MQDYINFEDVTTPSKRQSGHDDCIFLVPVVDPAPDPTGAVTCQYPQGIQPKHRPTMYCRSSTSKQTLDHFDYHQLDMFLLELSFLCLICIHDDAKKKNDYKQQMMTGSNIVFSFPLICDNACQLVVVISSHHSIVPLLERIGDKIWP